MSIIAEYNPDLALRNISEFKSGNREKEECIPEDLRVGKIYQFLKQGQRHYWLEGEVPLAETKGQNQLSLPIASVIILEVTHFVEKNKIYTKGKYKVVEIFKDNKIHFERFNRI